MRPAVLSPSLTGACQHPLPLTMPSAYQTHAFTFSPSTSGLVSLPPIAWTCPSLLMRFHEPRLDEVAVNRWAVGIDHHKCPLSRASITNAKECTNRCLSRFPGKLI